MNLMIPRYKPYFKIVDFLNFLLSPNVTMHQVEQTFAQKANCKYALILPYGRSAYYFLLKAYEFKNQEVILPAYTCNTLAGPIIETQNNPVFIDSSENGYNMDQDKITQKINEGTRMIMFSEIWGDPINIKSLTSFVDKDILLVGDYSLSLFSYFENNKDALKWLDVAFFSFGLGKEISALGGGIIITDDEEIYNKIRKIRDSTCARPGYFKGVKIFLKMFASIIVFSKLFYKYLMYLSEKTNLLNKLKGNNIDITVNLPADFFILPTKLQLYIIKNRLSRTDVFVAERHRALQHYYDELKKEGILNFYPFTLASNLAFNCNGKTIKNIQEELFNNNAHTATVYKRSLPETLKQDKEPYPIAEKLAKNLTMLPLYYGIKETEIQQVVKVLKGAIQKFKT